MKHRVGFWLTYLSAFLIVTGTSAQTKIDEPQTVQTSVQANILSYVEEPYTLRMGKHYDTRKLKVLPLKYLASLLVFTLCSPSVAAEQPFDPSVPIPVVYPVTPELVASSGAWLGRGWTRRPLRFSEPGPIRPFNYVISVEAELEPTPELLLLERTRLLKGPPPPSDRLTFDFETNEVRLKTGDRILRYSLEERRVEAQPMGRVSWSYVTPGPESEDVLMVPMRGARAAAERPNMIVVFRVARDEPEIWRQTVIPLRSLHLDVERLDAEGYGLFREGPVTALFLPGYNTVTLPGFNSDGRVWEIHLPDASHRYMRVHLFPMPLPRE